MGVYKQLTMMGGWFDADKAERLDLVQRWFPKIKSRTKFDGAEQLAKIPTEQHQSMKRRIHIVNTRYGAAQDA